MTGCERQGAGRLQVERDVGEGRLESHARGDVEIEDELLEGLFHLPIGGGRRSG